LDLESGKADSVRGRTALVLAHLHRIDPDAHMARFYCIELAPTLFGEVAVLRRWGRIGTRGRTTTESWLSPCEAEEAAGRTLQQKLARGYISASGTNESEPRRRKTPEVG
jgi:predicted DNA-binding WGR domain protein